MEKLHIVSWSGGKDSTASIILAHENGDPIDLIVMCVVYFDRERDIYGENPDQMAWVLNYAKPLFESWGYKVVLVPTRYDYVHYFYHTIKSSPKPERNGKLAGWLLGGMCRMTEQKTRAIHNYLKMLIKDSIEYVGIATDEPERLQRLKEKKGKISLLEKYGYSEQKAKELCEQYGLLSPIYGFAKRGGGCWFCPNATIPEAASIRKNHPHLWAELEKLDKEPNKVSEGYKYGKTFKQFTAEIDNYIAVELNQISIFDLIKDGGA